MEGNNPYDSLTNAIARAREKRKPFNPLQPINPYGRPTVMTDDVLEKLKQAFLFGCTDAQACAFADIGTSAFYDYQKVNPDFVEEKEKWKENPILKAKATVYNKLGETETAKWYLERKAKDEFSMRVETTGKDGEALLKVEQDLEEEKDGEKSVIEELTKQVVAPNTPLQDQKQTG